MPKRQSTQRVMSPEMQGDDSWIEITAPTMEQMKGYRKQLKPLQERLEQLKKEGKTESSVEVQEINEAIGEAGKSLVSQYVKAWNWVDNDDAPLPQPAEKGAVDTLNLREIKWIMKQFQFDDSEKKG